MPARWAGGSLFILVLRLSGKALSMICRDKLYDMSSIMALLVVRLQSYNGACRGDNGGVIVA